MNKNTSVKISAVSSIFVGLLILFFYFRETLPLTDVFVAKKEFGFYLFYAVMAVAGLFLFLKGSKSKKGIYYGLSALFVLGIPLLFYTVSRAPWDYAPRRLEMIERGLIPVFFLLMGILAWAEIRWSHGVLMAVFSVLGLYHLISAIKLISGAGGAFSSVHTGDVMIAFAIAVISLIFAFYNLKALKRPDVA